MDEPLTRERETARQRALRIPLEYHRARTGLGRAKAGLTIFFLVLGVLYLTWVLYGGRPAQTQLSPGALASGHARWENDCRACHLPLTPVRSDSAASRGAGILLGAAQDAADAKCSECHKTAGPHHANQFAAEIGSCASCHREHRGLQASLSPMSDQECIRCHGSIAYHRRTGPAASADTAARIKDVSAFAVTEGQAGPHPKFRSLELASDPGHIRFSHRLHMIPGQLYPGQTLPPGKGVVQLACDSCHQDSPATLGGGGAYMQPISFARHCQSCHPLQVPGKAAAIPHGLKGEQLETVVAGLFAAEEKTPAQNHPWLIPGKTRLHPREQQPPQALVTASHLQQLRTNSCSKCHSWQQEKPTEVVPASIPEVWLKGAKFNHAAHRAAAKCQDCHPRAYEPASGSQPGSLADNERIMIPDIDNCARCHAPKNDSAGSGGARYDCAECHRYHHPPSKEKPLVIASHLASQISNLKSQIPEPNSQFSASNTFVGTQSCSATGCHGAAKGNDLTASSTRFTANDPHTRAFLLLYTEPSLDIYRRLTNQPQAKFEDAPYFEFLQQKCVGCHATPPPDTSKATRPESYATGISCESCHGPAASWEYTHFNRKAKKSSDMRNLSDLSIRATACAECHIGPQMDSGNSYDVNHDLIAAGHPRLTFEFEAQLANLPSHWSAAKDVKSHFDAWRIGELATAAQQDKLHAARPPLEFASHRCFDCHHGLISKPAAARNAFPPFSGISQQERTRLVNLPNYQKAHAAILLEMINLAEGQPATRSAGTLWEQNVKLLLALTAYNADNPRNVALARDADDLNVLLSHSFRTLPRDKHIENQPYFTGGPYDSPTGFDPNEERLKKVREDLGKFNTAMIVQELHKLQAKHGFLPRHELVALAERLAVPLYRIQEVVSFFPHYRTEKPPEIEVHVCQDMACHLRGSAKLIADLQTTLEGTASEIRVCGVSCLGRCDRAPAARIYDNRHQQSGEHPVYNLHGRSAREIAEAAKMLFTGKPTQLIPNDTDHAWQAPQHDWQINIYSGQPAAERYASIRWFIQASTRPSTGAIDAEARAAAVQTVLGSLKTAWLLGLGGEGGRAYKKWEETLKEHQKRGEQAYVVCNGDESEPATFKDRELFLRAPHLVVEGVILAGLLLGATKGYIYIRHEYEEQIETVREEIKAAEQAGLCGENILGSGLSFPVEVFVSPGGYICGEQTALIEAIQDHRAEPRNRPPELQTNGLWDMPTLLSNVETFAWVPAIIVRDQGKWFQEQGQEWNQWTHLTAKLAADTGDRGWTEAFGKGTHFKGRRFFSVSGDVERPGAYEVPIGITLGELIATCGGMRGGESLKAVALSGPSGGFQPRLIKVEHLSGKIRKMLPAEMKEFDLCELQLDMNLLRQWGLMLGAGITIYGESADLVEQAYSASHFYARESCGKCVPCRIGSTKIAQVASQLRERKLTRKQIDELFQKDGPLPDLAETMSSTAICGLGQIAANPLMSLLHYFPEEAYRYVTPT